MTTNPLASIYGPNPFRSLRQHMRTVMTAAEALPKLFQYLLDRDSDKVSATKVAIFEAEEAADGLKQEIREYLTTGMFLPVDRRDLLDLLNHQDEIANTAQDVAGLLVERRMDVPLALQDNLPIFVESSLAACRMAYRIIQRVDELVEAGFRTSETEPIREMIQEVNMLESLSDDEGIKMERLLFNYESEIDPVSVIFWHRLVEQIGDLADDAEQVGNRMRLVLAR